MIKKLKCQNTLYEEVAYFSEQSKGWVLFSKEGSWYTFEIKWYNAGQPLRAGHEKFEIVPFTSDRSEKLHTALEKMRPLDLPHSCQKKSATICQANRLGSREEGAFLLALIQDQDISALYKTMSASSIKKALEFCVERDLFAAFCRLLNEAADILSLKADSTFSIKEMSFIDISLQESIFFHCIRLKQPDCLRQLDLFDHFEQALELAASYGTPQIFDIILQKRRSSDPIDYKDLLKNAENHENWEMIDFCYKSS